MFSFLIAFSLGPSAACIEVEFSPKHGLTNLGIFTHDASGSNDVIPIYYLFHSSPLSIN